MLFTNKEDCVIVSDKAGDVYRLGYKALCLGGLHSLDDHVLLFTSLSSNTVDFVELLNATYVPLSICLQTAMNPPTRSMF